MVNKQWMPGVLKSKSPAWQVLPGVPGKTPQLCLWTPYGGISIALGTENMCSLSFTSKPWQKEETCVVLSLPDDNHLRGAGKVTLRHWDALLNVLADHVHIIPGKDGACRSSACSALAQLLCRRLTCLQLSACKLLRQLMHCLADTNNLADKTDHPASTHLSCALIGTMGAPSAIVPAMNLRIASCWFWAADSVTCT
jgi:hypothetical protein